MIPKGSETYRLWYMLEHDAALHRMMLRSLQSAAEHNPDTTTNPVRTLDDLYRFLDTFITSMPWQAVERFSGKTNAEASLFRRIDQAMGYFYYLFDQPLDELKDKGYVYPSLQYEPRIAQWIVQYNSMWGLYLSNENSWNAEHLQLVSADPLFGLQNGWYESPDNWHSWNDFFSRRLATPQVRPIADSCLVSPCDGKQMPWLQIDENGFLITDDAQGLQVKTSTVFEVNKLLLGEHKDVFNGGVMTHIVLDMHNYHHFHSPVDGTIVEINHIIEYKALSGGHIIRDQEQHRYRYEHEKTDCLDYQLHEPRKVFIIKTDDDRYVALVAVTVAQVGKINQADNIYVGCRVSRGTDLGHFLCGSDVLLLISKEKTMPTTSLPSQNAKDIKPFTIPETSHFLKSPTPASPVLVGQSML